MYIRKIEKRGWCQSFWDTSPKKSIIFLTPSLTDVNQFCIIFRSKKLDTVKEAAKKVLLLFPPPS